MRTFLFLCSALSLLVSAHKFSLAEPSGQYKGALFFLLLGIQMLITGALIGDHQDERDLKAQKAVDQEDRKEAGLSGVNTSVKEGEKS